MSSSFVYAKVVSSSLKEMQPLTSSRVWKELYVRPRLIINIFYNISAEAELSNSFICTFVKTSSSMLWQLQYVFIFSFYTEALEHRTWSTHHKLHTDNGRLGEAENILFQSLSLSSCSKCKKQCIFYQRMRISISMDMSFTTIAFSFLS